jgi:uncharacterized protein involved in tolerance to divalent cations
MSASIVDEAKAIVDDLVKRGVAYAVGLYPFFHSTVWWRGSNVKRALESAFGTNEAERVYSELERVFKNIDLYVKVRVGDQEKYPADFLKKYILEEHITRVILEEIEKRFNQMPEGEKKVLSIANAIIDKLKGIDYPGLSVRKGGEGFLSVGVFDADHFPDIVLSVLGFDVPDIRAFLYKYLLGFHDEAASRTSEFVTKYLHMKLGMRRPW